MPSRDVRKVAMIQFLSSPWASVVLLTALLVVLVAVGVYVIGKLRGGSEEELPGASELMTNFRELHTQGELSDEEYRKIKAMLAEKLEDELKRPAKPE